MEDKYQFENLTAWQKAKDLAKVVYQLVAKFPHIQSIAFLMHSQYPYPNPNQG